MSSTVWRMFELGGGSAHGCGPEPEVDWSARPDRAGQNHYNNASVGKRIQQDNRRGMV
jgi:hypothetical protein